MRIGIVCPYSFDVPGGVQFHVRDLAEEFIGQGHHVEVLAPAEDDTPVPEWLEAAGRSVPVPYNGSVARLSFGPLSAARVRRWLRTGGFDVLHIHEPITPSLGMLALWIARGPIVATFHSSLTRSRALQVASNFVRASMEKIGGRIAVSEDARRTLVEHLGGDAVVVPNGVYVQDFATAAPDPRWQGTDRAPTIAFLGRVDEPRKGLKVLLGAVPGILAAHPGARFLVAGYGDAGETVEAELGEAAGCVELLGGIEETDKRALLASVDVYVAPQTGGESFGIVLVEAMSAGAAVVASDLGAFRRVLDEGALGALFTSEDSADLARVVRATLADGEATAARRAAARLAVRRYDWSVVSAQIMAVYEMALGGALEGPVEEDPASLPPKPLEAASPDGPTADAGTAGAPDRGAAPRRTGPVPARTGSLPGTGGPRGPAGCSGDPAGRGGNAVGQAEEASGRDGNAVRRGGNIVGQGGNAGGDGTATGPGENAVGPDGTDRRGAARDEPVGAGGPSGGTVGPGTGEAKSS